MENKYNHINDCWKALKTLSRLEDLEDTLDNFPRWSGDWEYEIDVDNAVVTVTNSHYDKLTEYWEEDTEELWQFSREEIEEFAEEIGYED